MYSFSALSLFHLLRCHRYDLLSMDAMEMSFQKSASGGGVA